MRIAIVAPHIILGGGETSIRTLMKAMPQHTFGIFYLHEPDAMVERCSYTSVPNVVRVARTKALARQLGEFGADIAMAYSSGVGALCGACKAMRTPPKKIFLAKSHDTNGTYRHWIQWRNSMDAAVAVSPQIGLEMMRVGPDQIWEPGREKCFVIPQGVDREVFHDERPRDGSIRTVGYVGRIAGGKGLNVVARGLAGLRLTWLVCGPGTQKMPVSLLQKWCRRWRVRFEHMPAIQYPVEAYKRSDLLILLSQREGCPNAVTEAAAMGVPTIATRVGTLPDYWQHDETIFFVDNASELRSAMRRLLRRPDLVRRVGENARRLSEEFDVRNTAEKYQRVFDGVVTGEPPAPRGYVLGRSGGHGDVVCAEPVLRSLLERGVPHLLHSDSPVAGLIGRAHLPLKADRPLPLVYRRFDRHICKQYCDHVPSPAPVPASPQIEMSEPREAGRIGLHTHAKKELKRWPLSRWECLARALKSRGFRCVQVDGERRIESVDDHVERQSIPDYARTLAGLDALVTTEGFPHHLAVALGTRVIVIWSGAVSEPLCAYDDIEIVRPNLECRCYGATYQKMLPTNCPSAVRSTMPPCMDSIRVGDVVAAVCRAMSPEREEALV